MSPLRPVVPSRGVCGQREEQDVGEDEPARVSEQPDEVRVGYDTSEEVDEDGRRRYESNDDVRKQKSNESQLPGGDPRREY